MQSVEEKKAYDNVIVKTCYVTDVLYLMLHIIYLVLFLIAKVYVMVYINIGSIVIYMLFYFLIKNKKYYLYALGCGNEFLISMSVSTILVGFNAGFHLCIIGLCVVSFFTVYFSKQNRDVKNAFTWCVLSLLIYLGLLFYCSFNNPEYVLDKWLVITLSSIHSIAVFAFIAAYLMIFLKYAMQLEQRIINESRIDNLTQIHNRYDLYNYVESIEIKKDYVLSMFDIDDFKKINDVYGHVCGDYILKEVASIASTTLATSFVSRFGGEEFVVISRLNGNIENTFRDIDMLRKRIEENTFVFNENLIHITVTIGIQQFEEEFNIEKWISSADNKLYSGKKAGKNRTII